MIDYEQNEKSFLKAVTETMIPLVNEIPKPVDESDFFPGRRFFVECFSPFQAIIFLEMEFSLKKQIISKIYHRNWNEISNVMRDDCMLEILNIIVRKYIVNSDIPEDVRYRCSSPRVIYDEYEDDMEVSTLDMYRFEYHMKHGAFALILASSPGPHLEQSDLERKQQD